MFVWDWKKLLFHLVLAQLAAIPRQAAPCTMFKPPFNIIIISIIIYIIIIVIIMIIINPTQPQKNPKKKITRARFLGRPPTMPTSLFSGLSRGSDLFNRCLLHLGEILHHQARGNIYVAHHPSRHSRENIHLTLLHRAIQNMGL